ncbi:MAG: deoxyribose-phosphate aldolase [Eubacteriales bacterium]|nr:deoxyribose-phosphate aldolase [Eubacteriales bacterium]
MREEFKEILSKADHTLLAQTATWEEIKKICEEGMEYSIASVCIPPCYVKQAKNFIKDNLKICTVIGFPNGNTTTAVKVFETEDAIKNGADEIDMVISIGEVKAGNYDTVLEEIKAVKKVCQDKILKVIIEACLLTTEEKIRMCQVITEAGADFIKTSTGFSSSGATREDVSLFVKHVGENIKIKAAGGINSLDDAKDFLELGASRLGTSRLIRLVKNEEKLY